MTFLRSQDESSRATSCAQKFNFGPEEEGDQRRGTENWTPTIGIYGAPESYATRFEGDGLQNGLSSVCAAVAVEIDPNYADAWQLVAMAEMRCAQLHA